MDLAERAEERAASPCSRSIPRSLRRASSRTSSASAVEEHGAQVVVIDSLNGYLNAMPEERFLTLHLHELLTYLGEHGVATILVMAQHGLIGSNMISPVDVSYLADCVVLLRYYEAEGELHKAISVMKKRSGDHEKAIREFSMGSGAASTSARRSNTSAAFFPASPSSKTDDCTDRTERRDQHPAAAHPAPRADGAGCGDDGADPFARRLRVAKPCATRKSCAARSKRVPGWPSSPPRR